MSSRCEPSPLVAWGRGCAYAAPVLTVFAVGVGAPLYTVDMRTAAATSRLLVANAATLGALLLLVVALVGLVAHGQRQLGTVGQVAGLVALVGTVLAAGGGWDSLFALPYMADTAPEVLSRPTDGTLLAGFLLSYAVMAAGWTCFSVALRRVRVISRVTSVVLVAGAVFALLPAPTAIRVAPLVVGCALAYRALVADHHRAG